ncbi:MAG: undecaprenyl-diphosphate phosphatase [Candidatus Marinimicrobia bacterium]|nr:undecaprenyl-diphosphate phosphatase [Candidatus Neomarinimicrobiota bacterium]
MSVLEAIILGIIQGVTEFLPISSSGHLVVAQHLLGIQPPGVLLEVVLHLGTLGAIFIYYRQDIIGLIAGVFRGAESAWKLFVQIFVATLPAAILGVFANNIIADSYSIHLVPWTFLTTAGIIAATYYFRGANAGNITLFAAIIIGCAQVFALLPGISRSGITLATAIFLGLNRTSAARFVFLMAIPVLLGAGMLQFFHMSQSDQSIALFPLSIGFISALISGLLVMRWLIAVISKGRFYLFSLYCLGVSILAFQL